MKSELLAAAISEYLTNGGQIETVEDEADCSQVLKKTVKHREVDPALIEAIASYRDAGVVAAAKGLRKHVTTIIRLAEKHGIKFNTSVHENRLAARKAANALAPKIRKLKAKGYSQMQMCKELGVGRCVLRRIMNDNGITSN